MSDFDKFLTDSFGAAKQVVEESVDSAKDGLKSFLDGFSSNRAKAIPQQAPAAPPEPIKTLPNDPDGFWTNLKQKWHTEAPQRQAEISAIKQKEFGEELPSVIQNLEKALSSKGMDGTVRRILRTEYRDLTGREYESRTKSSNIKPLSDATNVLPATDVKMPRALEAAGEFAQAAGEGVQDAALAMGAGVNTSSALATAGEMLADPLNLIPGGKGVAGAAAVIKIGGKKITETMTDATFASILHSITGNPDDIARVIKGKKLSSDEREQMLLEALQAKKSGAESTVVNSSFIPSKYIKTPYDPKTGYSSELNNPIHLGADAPPGLAGARLSGFTDPNNKYFHGYDKNGEKFTIEASRVNPDWITASKDGNKTAEYFRERLKGK